MLTTSESSIKEQLHKPMLLSPAGKDYLWGGRRLVEEFGKSWGDGPLAESWECSVHADGPSLIASGPWKGKALAELITVYPELLGRHGAESADCDSKEALSASVSKFPVLVKLIDAAGDLSIQVHPDDAYAWEKEGQQGKIELWYVMDAAPDAELIYGFVREVTQEQVRRAAENGTIVDYVQRIPVKKDDVFLVRPGTVHAIGKGVLLAEIQENSNLTYRLYDYDRVDKDGQKRMLHLDKALQVLDYKASPPVRQQMRLLKYTPGAAQESLCQCPYFQVDRLLLSESLNWQIGASGFQILLVLEGTLRLGELTVTKGNCIFLPADMGEVFLQGHGQLLRISC